jgi:hypothetical protein
MYKILALFCSIICFTNTYTQSQTKRVLFLGNSYTQVNDLPQMVANIALSTGDKLFFDSNTPGGYTLELHSTNSTSLSKIAVGNWDYVVLQEQSQLPSFPISMVQTEVFPFAKYLDSIIHQKNNCAETVFYMTWGRKNGDANNCSFWPPVCTYEGMDSLLNLRYSIMADTYNALLSPVGAVWKYIRENYPSINLYQADESHPSVAGTYAAACCFYTVFFRKDPTLINFNASLSATDAANIRTATKNIVYNQLLKWHIGEYIPKANFNITMLDSNQVKFTNTSINTKNYVWHFGDGNTATDFSPTYQYKNAGTYTAKLIANKCSIADTLAKTIIITTIENNNTNNTESFSIYPNPSTSFLNIKQNFAKNIYYKIVTVTGKIVQSGILKNAENKINIAHLIDGIYFIQFYDNKQSVGQKKLLKSSK